MVQGPPTSKNREQRIIREQNSFAASEQPSRLIESHSR